MQAVRSPHRPGLVGVISGDLARFPEFYTSLMNLRVPAGSSWQWVRGNGIAANRNIITRHLEGDWLFFLDDDQVFDPDCLLRLLDREVDIVQALISTRKPPFLPYAYHHDPARNLFQGAAWAEIPPAGLSRWDAVGTGGTLIRRRVVDALADPWFEEGRTDKEHLGEDLSFMLKARAHGFHCWVDSEVRMGHLNTHAVWPAQSADRVWCVDLDLAHGVRVRTSTTLGQHAPTL